MPITFRMAEHSIRPGLRIVEMVLGNDVVGTIYPDPERDGIIIVSAHFSERDVPDDFDGEVIMDVGENDFPPIPAVKITFEPRRYIIVDRKIQHLE